MSLGCWSGKIEHFYFSVLSFVKQFVQQNKVFKKLIAKEKSKEI